MKRYICLIGVALAVTSGCRKAEHLVYSDIARVQLKDTATVSKTFIYADAAVTTDTVFIEVNTIGGITDHDRPVKLVQITEYEETYVRDPVTNQITDTLITERPFKAEPGVHYKDLGDPSLAPMMVVKAHDVKAMVPVILLRDASLKDNSHRLRLQLAANEEFGIGEVKATEVTIVFSDRLERFYSWRVDSYLAPAFGTFGRYSTGKHQFMVDVLNEAIDEKWYQAALNAGALANYANLLKQALNTFNNDPDNIASGKAPLRESDDPSSSAVTFP
ncbi:DUF4843 domain-containing protein [Chitinophaga sp. XS-30]|uniref:DUF4843 domain-containing protein n=1 Tax=Chitinophaga sp. XS-30 TaxID=2604421 RepID=UPI0011DE01D4|nr:DUF4843 domain-containing protein [Chitinophaga sp. XS-30]QEH42484.1 DUF4843 domain-containing protein [Chitinophaga sp. XS-30]